MSKEKNKKTKILRRIILIVLAAAVLSCTVALGWCIIVDRPAVQTLADYRNAHEAAVINVAEDGGIELIPKDGSKNTGIIFYVGAQIVPQAYIPLLSRLTEKGYSCFIPNLTFNLAAFEPSAAEEIIKAHPEITSWYMAGHSLGGLTAAGFADSHREIVDGLILLAAYTSGDMSDADIPTVSIYGDRDGVLNMSLYKKRLAWNPSDFEEYVIKGANHAQFGDYGEQPRDNAAEISSGEQQRQTAEIILDWLSRK